MKLRDYAGDLVLFLIIVWTLWAALVILRAMQ